MIQSISVGGGAALILSAFAATFMPDTPIKVHSLSYDGGYVVQDSTITSSNDFVYLQHRAEVIDVDTGMPVPGCSGVGSGNYQVGRSTTRAPLNDWTSAPWCGPDALSPGEYHLRVVYSWGSDRQVAARSDRFEVSK